jgi:hypothetical protein
MTKSATVHMIIAITAAAAVAAAAVVMMPGAPQAEQVQARTQVEQALPQPHPKGDRLPLLVTGAACSSHSWPNYEQSCQFDLRRSAGDVRSVRVVGLERRASTNVLVAVR